MHFIFALRRLGVAAVFGLLALSAAAQWQWTDKDGRRVFSDRPPPADVREQDIVKRPGAARTPAAVSPDSAFPAAVPATTRTAASAPRLSGKDPQLEARKKQADDESAAKKKADEDKLALVKKENCERARRGLVTFDSGVRVAITNAKGEREFLDDAARAAETRRLQAIVASDCV